MYDALIGYTGFVGSNILKQHPFPHCYNSKNYQELAGNKFNTVVCAGISAVKWLANKNPEEDLEKIKKLAGVLKTVEAETFILISTIDVYSNPDSRHNEDFDPGTEANHAYGMNRLWFENFCLEQFPNLLLVRLPGLFGVGLKKNVIYDLLNNNCLEMINPKSSFQYYYLKNIWNDISIALEHNLRVINLFSEPLPTFEIIASFFPRAIVGGQAAPEGHYSATSKYAEIWGKTGDYIYTKNEVLQQLKDYLESERK